jgi:hypothetical protein
MLAASHVFERFMLPPGSRSVHASHIPHALAMVVATNGTLLIRDPRSAVGGPPVGA